MNFRLFSLSYYFISIRFKTVYCMSSIKILNLQNASLVKTTFYTVFRFDAASQDSFGVVYIVYSRIVCMRQQHPIHVI